MSDDDLQRYAGSVHGTVRGERRLLLLALAAIVAGPIAWLVHLWVLTLIADIPCRSVDGQDVLGIPVEAWWLLVSLGAVIVASAGVALAWRIRSRLGAGSRDAPNVAGPSDQEGRSGGVIGPLATLGLWSSALFLATILLASTAPIFLTCP